MMRYTTPPLLLVIDCQYGFVTDDSAPIIPTVARLISAWKSANLPVIATRFINPPESPYRRLINWDKCDTSPEIDLVHEIASLLTDYGTKISKGVYSALTPEWIASLQEAGTQDIVLVGIDTDGCVLKSALDAFEANFTPWIVTDATASHSGTRAYDAALYIAGRTIGRDQLVTTEDALTALAADGRARDL